MKKNSPGGLCDSHSGRAERHRTAKKHRAYFYCEIFNCRMYFPQKRCSVYDLLVSFRSWCHNSVMGS